MILNKARTDMVYLVIGSAVGSVATYMMVGSGASSVASSDDKLEHPRNRQLMTSRIPTVNSLYKAAYVTDWTAAQISGTILREFGVCASGTGVTGSMWSRSVLTPITFNGTNELRIEETWEYY